MADSDIEIDNIEDGVEVQIIMERQASMPRPTEELDFMTHTHTHTHFTCFPHPWGRPYQTSPVMRASVGGAVVLLLLTSAYPLSIGNSVKIRNGYDDNVQGI
jgi:hypothetical protein